jgi:protein-tyrosine phosphatase
MRENFSSSIAGVRTHTPPPGLVSATIDAVDAGRGSMHRRVAGVEILVVCSANRCRSPMGAGLLQGRFTDQGSEAVVRSAGFGPAGEPATPETVAVMAEVGVDLGSHRSTLVTAAACARADLVICMTRQHVVELVVLDPDSWPRTFPLVDLVRRAQQVGPRRHGEPSKAWIQRVHGGRQRSSVLSLPGTDDIADPIGNPVGAFRRTRDELGRLIAPLTQLLAPVGTRSNDHGLEWTPWEK